MAINSYDVTSEKKKLKSLEPKSPYLTSDRVQLLSRVTEKRVIQKKTLDYVSSFPLAVNIYKASSDEFKCLKRAKKKIKKSVLTLPNEPSPAPQVCTVSDMNDSEYYSQHNDNQKPRFKKRSSIKNVRKTRVKNKDFEFYDRDARYCSQLNINLDSSSTDLIKDYKGDGKRVSKQKKGYKCSYSSQRNKENEGAIKPHDVWAMLRNMNRFQFKPSPPASEESILTIKKKKATRKRVNCKDTRVIETKCRTEEIAYISSYKVDESSRNLSQTSSFDRVTVIDKEDEFNKVCKEFKANFLKARGLNDLHKNNNRQEKNNKIQKKRLKKSHAKSIVLTLSKENNTPQMQHDLFLKTVNDQDDTDNNAIGVSSLIKIDDCCNLNEVTDDSEHTSVCSKSSNKEIEGKIKCTEPVKDCCAYSNNSGSSKAEIIADVTNKTKERNIFNARVPQLKGISKVTFGKKCEPINQVQGPKYVDEQKRKPRMTTTMPSGCRMPKLTKTDIKRRLNLMKFPMVILGKDQLNSPIEIQTYNPPQFEGLEKQIWPFMVGWDPKHQVKSEEEIIKYNVELTDNNSQLLKKPDNSYTDCNSNKLKKINNNVASNKRLNCKPKNQIANGDLMINKNKTELRRQVAYPGLNKKIQLFKKQESLTNIKDKMLNLLYKKISDRNIDNDINNPKENINEHRCNSPKMKVDASTEIRTTSIENKTSPMRTKANASPIRKQNKKYQLNQVSRGHPWAKAKWASDFIENVIKKIKSGVYYNQDINCITEISVQTEPIFEQEHLRTDFSPKVTIKKKHLDGPKLIPGFESSLPGLEIKTLNMNQISIKHCIANVMMQFDVTVPSETKHLLLSPKASVTLIPTESTEGHTKILKCKTTILNAMLPAELCSIVPKMIRLFESHITSARPPPIFSGPVSKKESHLTTVHESTPINNAVTTTESPLSAKSFIDFFPPAVKKILGGMFSVVNGRNMPNNHKKTKASPFFGYDITVNHLLPNIGFKSTDILRFRIRSLVPQFIEKKENIIMPKQSQTVLPNFLLKRMPKCTALDHYDIKNKRLVLPFQPYDFDNMIKNILMRQKLFIINMNIMLGINTAEIRYDRKLLNISVNNEIKDKGLVNKSRSVTAPDKSDKSLIVTSPKKCIEYIKRSTGCNYENRHEHFQTDYKITNNKHKRRGFYRLYRKCKSTSNIPSGEKYNTPLNKIQTVEDFFHVLGAKKSMSSVFDGYAARKILSSIGEMKNWISDINSRQALLVLLLTNKKDTPNLVRFRPVILQGIAVNRITRATELDMEIEVVERENLNKLSQYEGISYLPASIENHDQLLEELYWIAKTTASDYQRPFDESSERLLRSLLEKRKKLNPSYLRVMARYVGLGLLKSPTKK